MAGTRGGPTSIRNRLVAIFAVSASILLVLTCALLYIAFDAQLEGTIDQTLRDRANDITLDLQEGNVQIRSGEPFAQLLAADSGQLIDSTTTAASRPPVLSRRELVRARNHEIVVERRRVTGLGDRGRVLARPETTKEGQSVVVVVGESLDAVARARQRLGLLLGITSPLLIGAIAGCGWVLAGAALRPVERLTEEAEAISLQKGGQRLPQPPGDDEIAHLGRTLNAMLDRIESSLARERAFVDDASHELRTPLSILRGELELACDRPGNRAEMRKSLQSALAEAEQLGRLTEDLLTLARADGGRLDPRLQPVDLLETTRLAVARYGVAGGPALQVDGDEVEVTADPMLLERLLRNSIANATRYARSRVQLTVGTDDGWGRLTVADDGAGFPAEFLPVAFDRFTRADADRGRDHGGSGLGLAIVAAVVRAQNGRVEVDNASALGGGRLRVWLPLTPDQVPATANGQKSASEPVAGAVAAGPNGSVALPAG
jgi:signal transduction histidine kinase